MSEKPWMRWKVTLTTNKVITFCFIFRASRSIVLNYENDKCTVLNSQTPLVHISWPPSVSIYGSFWFELVVCQMMFSRIPPIPSRCSWDVQVSFFPARSILTRCDRFHLIFSVECAQSNRIFLFLSLRLYLFVEFFFP